MQFSRDDVLSFPAAAQDLSSQIVGIWRIKKIERIDVESRGNISAFRRPPDGLLHLHKGR